MNHTGVGENGANRMVAFYYTLMEADTLTNAESKPKTTKKTSNDKIIKPSSNSVTEPAKVKEKEKEEKQQTHSQPQSRQQSDLPSLNVNIQVHISSDATPDQIEKIFEAMGKHIYNR